MVGSVGYRDGKGGAKAHAVFCSLDSNPVVTIVCHVTSQLPKCTLHCAEGSVFGVDGPEDILYKFKNRLERALTTAPRT